MNRASRRDYRSQKKLRKVACFRSMPHLPSPIKGDSMLLRHMRDVVADNDVRYTESYKPLVLPKCESSMKGC